MRYLPILFLLLIQAVHSANLSISPKLKNIKLKQYTALNVELVPDLGTRFIFPFILDEANDLIPFTLDITNPLFVSTRHEGRNSFTIEIDPPKEGGKTPQYLGNLFITAGGYNISVVLSATNSLKKHVSDYVFELTKEAREDLIQQAIGKRTKALEASYQSKFASLEQQASVLALKQVGTLALSQPVKESIKEEKVLRLDSGEEVILYLERLSTYGGRYKLFQYEVTNDTAEDLRITDAALLTIDENGITQKMFSSNTIMPRIDIGETVAGVITTDSASVSNQDLSIRLSVLTSAGLVEVDW